MLKYNPDKFNRYNLRSKLDFKITDFWSISNNTSLIIKDYERPSSLGSSYFWEINRISPLELLENPDGSWTKKEPKSLE